MSIPPVQQDSTLWHEHFTSYSLLDRRFFMQIHTLQKIIKSLEVC